MSAAKFNAEFNENFLLKFHLKLFDEFSEKLDYMGVTPVTFFFVRAKNKKLRLSFAKSMINKHETYRNLRTKANLTFLVPMVE